MISYKSVQDALGRRAVVQFSCSASLFAKLVTAALVFYFFAEDDLMGFLSHS